MRYGYLRESVSTPKVDASELYTEDKKRLLELGAEVIIEDRFNVSGRDRVKLERLVSNELKEGDILYILRLGSLDDSLGRAVNVIELAFDKGAKVYLDGVGLIERSNKNTAYLLLGKIEEAERDMATAKSYEGKALAKQKGELNDGRPRIPETLMNHAIEIMEKHGIQKAIDVTGISKSSIMREKTRRKNKRK